VLELRVVEECGGKKGKGGKGKKGDEVGVELGRGRAPPALASAMKVENPTTNTLNMDVDSSFINQPLQQTQILEPAQQHTSQLQQYLLATFTLFSFFNSPLTLRSSPHSPHAHTGTMLSWHLVGSPHPKHPQVTFVTSIPMSGMLQVSM